MRTVIVIFGGFLIFAALHMVARLFELSSALASAGFLFLWLVVATFNLWFGVAKAGYPLDEEWVIFMAIFGLPTAVALSVQWKLL